MSNPDLKFALAANAALAQELAKARERIAELEQIEEAAYQAGVVLVDALDANNKIMAVKT